MPRGGARSGAGRKAGGANVKTRAIATRAAAEGITPLEVMLEAMRSFYAQGHMVRAAALARDAAPFMHPRFTSVTVDARVHVAATALTDAEISTRIEQLRASLPDRGPPPLLRLIEG